MKMTVLLRNAESVYMGYHRREFWQTNISRKDSMNMGITRANIPTGYGFTKPGKYNLPWQ